MPKGGILYLIMVFAPWEAIIKYNVLSPMGVFVLGGIYYGTIVLFRKFHIHKKKKLSVEKARILSLYIISKH